MYYEKYIEYKNNYLDLKYNLEGGNTKYTINIKDVENPSVQILIKKEYDNLLRFNLEFQQVDINLDTTYKNINDNLYLYDNYNISKSNKIDETYWKTIANLLKCNFIIIIDHGQNITDLYNNITKDEILNKYYIEYYDK